jgi:hypothetical protein
VRRAASNICSNDHHLVVPGRRDIDGPAQIHTVALSGGRLLLLGRKMALAPRAIGGELGIIGIIANHDPEPTVKPGLWSLAHGACGRFRRFEGFKRLVDEGRSVEDVAARFGVTVLLVTSA